MFHWIFIVIFLSDLLGTEVTDILAFTTIILLNLTLIKFIKIYSYLKSFDIFSFLEIPKILYVKLAD